MKQVRWHGRGGQGSFTIARLLGSAAVVYEGKKALAFPTFGPERRGAPVLGFTKVSDKKINDRSQVDTCDYVVVLDETLIDNNTSKGLRKSGCMIINTKNINKYKEMFDCEVIGLDATSIALKNIGRPITNTSMLGALIAKSKIISIKSAEKAIKSTLPKKLADKNLDALEEAYKSLVGERL
ncbi:MAG TPA: 2-oxoacid:acceptor oxidoreductase family protein [Anaerovoracaceae bacterium]|nr:2-oxoacid:acceptor oxidoreductase family protein [Anaerovoracaceae bacterium]